MTLPAQTFQPHTLTVYPACVPKNHAIPRLSSDAPVDCLPLGANPLGASAAE